MIRVNLRIIPDEQINGKWIRGKRVNKIWHNTWLGSKWSNLKSRCNKDYKLVKLNPCYEGCENHFTDFQDFAEWAVTQVGYAKNTELDKDILFKKNKIYSKSTCVFIPHKINTLLLRSDRGRGKWLIGVTKHNEESKFFLSSCKVNGKKTHIGLFKTELEAHIAYKEYKEQICKQYAEEFRDRIDHRVYEALINYKVEITD